jgi:hypothetical protein
MSTHSAPHFVVPPPHARPHLPPLQTSPVAHFVPQPPQFVGSTVESTHSLPQGIVPPLQKPPHVLAEQKSPAAHACPHDPQLSGLREVSTHRSPHFVVAPLHVSLGVSLGASSTVSRFERP